MDIRIIDPADIDLGRDFLFDEMEFAKKTGLYNKHGQIDFVVLNGNKLLDGFFVVKWAKRVGRPFVRCIVFDNLNRLEEIEMIMHFNKRRELDVIFFAKLLKEYVGLGGTINSLSNRINLTVEELKNTIELLEFDWDSNPNETSEPQQLSLF